MWGSKPPCRRVVGARVLHCRGESTEDDAVSNGADLLVECPRWPGVNAAVPNWVRRRGGWRAWAAGWSCSKVCDLRLPSYPSI
jgi:hypothetical protein